MPMTPSANTRDHRMGMRDMKSVAGIVALMGLLLGASLASAQTQSGCRKGTACRQQIEDGYKTCQATARAKWRAIVTVCKAAKRAKDLTPCKQAIQAGYHTTLAITSTRAEAATCPTDFPVDCGNGICCPSDFPICEASGDCCQA